MTHSGLCKACHKKHALLTHKCRKCDDKFCTSCKVKGKGKCPTCAAIASVWSNPDTRA